MSKPGYILLLVMAMLGAAACSRAGGDSSTGNPQDMGPTLKAFSLFTYQAPAGWTSQVAGGLTLGGFPQAVGPASHNFTPDITFITNGTHTIAQFAKSYQPHLIDMRPRQFALKLVDQEPFVTTAGIKGLRLHSIDPANPPIAEQFSYIFNNPDGLVFQFACACAPADAAHDAPIFDASMKTVKILHTGE